MRYEYQTVMLHSAHQVEPYLNVLGRDGWEVFQVTGGGYAPMDNQSNSVWIQQPYIVWLRRASGYVCETCQRVASAVEALK